MKRFHFFCEKAPKIPITLDKKQQIIKKDEIDGKKSKNEIKTILINKLANATFGKIEKIAVTGKGTPS